MNVVKKFFQWISLKEKLHDSEFDRPSFGEADVWWCSIGENVGNEISGKSEHFSRPVFVFKKLSRKLFLGIPTSTQKQYVVGWHVAIEVKGMKTSVILSQIRVLDSKRLTTRMGSVSKADFVKIKRAFEKLFLS